MSTLDIAFDVDGTLIHREGETSQDTPKYDVISLFKFFESRGNTMYVWSGGGVSYAESWVCKLGLKAIVVAKGSFIPDIAVDDMDVKLGKVNIRV